MSTVWTIIATAIGSTGLFSLVQFLIKRHDAKKDKTGILIGKIDKCERDGCRTQLLLLISLFPGQEQEIMKVAEHYFKGLHANWYMTALFQAYCKRRDIEIPQWALGTSNDLNRKEQI